MKTHYDIDSGMIQIWLPDGTLISVLREAVEDELNLGPAQAEQEDVISAQLRAQGYSSTQAGMLAREYLRYDS